MSPAAGSAGFHLREVLDLINARINDVQRDVAESERRTSAQLVEQKRQLDVIEQQVRATNGRVTAIEDARQHEAETVEARRAARRRIFELASHPLGEALKPAAALSAAGVAGWLAAHFHP